jgi:hypothetical protein
MLAAASAAQPLPLVLNVLCPDIWRHYCVPTQKGLTGAS